MCLEIHYKGGLFRVIDKSTGVVKLSTNEFATARNHMHYLRQQYMLQSQQKALNEWRGPFNWRNIAEGYVVPSNGGY